MNYFKTETNESVWSIVSLALNELKRFVEADEVAEQKLKAIAAELASTQYERLGWDAKTGEDENDVKLRSLIIGISLYGEIPSALQEATDRYKAGPIDTLDPELRTAIMAHAVRREITPDVVDVLLDAYPKATNSEFRDDIASALTSTKNEAVISRLAGLLKDSSLIRPQDFIHWFVWLLRNRYGRDTLWTWTRENWNWIQETYKGDSHYDMFPRYIAGALVSKQQADEYRTFFTPLESEVALSRNIKIGYNELESTVSLLETDGPTVRAALLDLK